MERAHGIDVSHHHPVTHWDRVVSAGVQLFGAKATNGTLVDRTFMAHRAGARANPFDLVLYYHFPTPNSRVHEQADHFVDAVMAGGGLRDNERLVLDVEPDPNNDDWCPSLEWIGAFIRRLTFAAPDRRPLVYTSARVWHDFLGEQWPDAILTDLWAPRYKSGAKEPALPVDMLDFPIWPKWTIWQDSRDWVCRGVSGPCDHNVFNGDRAALQAYAKLAGR